MFCNKCGKEIPEGILCADCQQPIAAETSVGAALTEPVLTEPVLTEPELTEAAPAIEETPAEPAPAEAASAIEETPAEAAPVDAAPVVEETPAEPAPVEAASAVEETPAEPAPVEVAPVEAAPVVEETPAEAAPVEAAPVEAASAIEETPAETAPVEAAPSAIVPAAPVTAAPVQEAPAQPAPAPEAAETPKKKKKWPKVLAIVLSIVLVLALAAGGVYWFLLERGVKKQSDPVNETMDRFCEELEELDIMGAVRLMLPEDIMTVLESYMEMGGTSFEDMLGESGSLLGDYKDIEVDYTIVGEPRKVDEDDPDRQSFEKLMTMIFVPDIEEVIEADVILETTTTYTNGGDDSEDTEISEMTVYVYQVDENWYFFPVEMEGESIMENLPF